MSIKSGPRVGYFSAIFMPGGREFERCNLQKFKCRSKDVCEVVCILTVATKGNLPKRFKRLNLREGESRILGLFCSLSCLLFLPRTYSGYGNFLSKEVHTGEEDGCF